MKFRAAFALVLLPFLAAAQQPALDPGALATVEGTVLRADTGELLRRAAVTIRVAEGRGTPLTVFTDVLGRFRIEGLPPGRYRLTADRNGYVRAEYGQRAPGRAGAVLAVGPGEQLRDVVLRMFPASAITGRVWDEYGDPVIGAQVRLFRYRYVEGGRQLALAGQAQTNDLGEYRVFGLFPGQYYLVISPTRMLTVAGVPGEVPAVPVELPGEEPSAPTYYPGTADPSRAVPVEIRAGEELRGVDISLARVRAVSVRGRLVRPPENAARGDLALRLTPRGVVSWILGGSEETPRWPDGDFEFRRVAPGSYIVLAMTMGAGEAWYAREAVEVGSTDVEGLLLTMLPAAQVYGRVVVEGDPQFQFDNVSVRLDAVQSSFGAPVPGPASTGGARAGVAAGGGFRIQRLPPDRYQIGIVNLPQGYYPKAARVAGRDILDEGLEVRGGQSVEVELLVSPAGGRATGIVVDEERRPVAAATVVLAPEESRRHLQRLYAAAQTDASGQFLLQGLAPGDYLLFAFDDLEPGQHLDPLFLRSYLERGARVRIAENAVAVAELRLLHAPR